MAPALARLSPAGRAAAADAQPQAARDRRARPARDRDQPGAAALDRLVCGRHLARDGLSGRADRRATARARLAVAIADHEVAPQVAYHRQQRAARSNCSTSGSSGSAPTLFVATLIVSRRDHRRARLRTRDSVDALQQLVHPDLGRLSRRSAPRCSGSASRAISAATRCARWRPPTRSSEIDAELRKRRQPVPRRRPRRAGRAGDARPTSTNGGWSTSSATCRDSS